MRGKAKEPGASRTYTSQGFPFSGFLLRVFDRTVGGPGHDGVLDPFGPEAKFGNDKAERTPISTKSVAAVIQTTRSDTAAPTLVEASEERTVHDES